MWNNSLARWKRDAEAWYKQDSAMFEGLLHTVETTIVRMHLSYELQHHPYGLLHIGRGR